jgi:hypothetical protein
VYGSVVVGDAGSVVESLLGTVVDEWANVVPVVADGFPPPQAAMKSPAATMANSSLPDRRSPIRL